MGMSTGAKVAIGCGIAAVLGMVIVVAVIGVGAYWARGKVKEMGVDLEEMTAKSEEIDRWQEKADANPYDPPADGVIPEARLVKFLEVRKDIYAIYAQHQAELERLAERAEKKDLSLSEGFAGVGKLASLTTDIRLAQVKALAEVGMSRDEYDDIQVAVYKSAWASEVEGETGQLPADAMRERAEQIPEQAREALEDAEGPPGSEGVSSEQVNAAAEQTAAAMKRAANAVEVPRENVELFRRHQDDIKKYAMSGLALVGL
jgi:hypothetical protein